MTIYNKMLTKASAHVRESGFWNRGNFCLWNLESWALESGIQLKESGILLRIGIQSKVPLEKTGIKCLESTYRTERLISVEDYTLNRESASR